METSLQIELIKHLENLVFDRRKGIIDSVLNKRTRYITILLEDIYQSQNASAVVRSCDCFGIQDVHIIENQNRYNINRDVALGSDKWLSIYKYNNSSNNSLNAINQLRDKGYRIVATTPHTEDTSLDNFDITKGKFVLLFGTELNGLSQQLLKESDEFLKIPMVGFTESLNISVSAAIILHYLSSKLRSSSVDWKLTNNEFRDLKLTWLKNSIRNSQIIEKNFLAKQTGNQ